MVKLLLEKERKELCYFSVDPKVVPADEVSRISIKPLFDNVAFDKKKYEVEYKPVFNTTESSSDSRNRKFTLFLEEGKLEIEQFFAGEQEHIFKIVEIGQEKKEVGVFHVYSLEDDLFARKPYKGDLHLHSCRSDGEGSPAYMAALGRMTGFDFLALTDHGNYNPSVEMQKKYEGLSLDIQLINGEEVHPPRSSNHLVNFGGGYSVNDLFETEKYEKEVRKIEEEVSPVPDGVDSYEFASFVWSSREIKKAGGLAVFCHPYWIAGNQHYISDKLTSYLLKKQPFDALEIINGSILAESNNLQIIEYYNYLTGTDSKKTPVIGVSDAHHCDLGVGYTVVFAEECTGEKIISSINDCYSVAAEERDQETRFYGQVRLVRYADFLEREIFSEHDRLCYEEGNYMLNYIMGEQD